MFADDAGPYANGARRARALCRRALVARGERDGALRARRAVDRATPATRSARWRARARTRSPNSYSHQDRPASPRASSTPTGCCAQTRPCLRDLAVPGRRAAGAGRLAAVEPHVRRQPQPEHGAVQRRHDVHRRRPAGAAAVPADAGGAPGRRPDALLQRPGRASRCSPARSRRRRAGRGTSSAACGSCSTPGPRCPTRWRCGCARSPRGHADHEVPLTSSWGTTETAPAATSAHFPDAVTGCIGVPFAGDHDQARARWPTSSRSGSTGRTSRPGYFRRARADRGGVRRGGLLPLGRRGQAGRRARPQPGTAVRRPDRRGLQAADRNLGDRRHRCGRGC